MYVLRSNIYKLLSLLQVLRKIVTDTRNICLGGDRPFSLSGAHGGFYGGEHVDHGAGDCDRYYLVVAL